MRSWNDFQKIQIASPLIVLLNNLLTQESCEPCTLVELRATNYATNTIIITLCVPSATKPKISIFAP